jgi:hypothetical protein
MRENTDSHRALNQHSPLKVIHSPRRNNIGCHKRKRRDQMHDEKKDHRIACFHNGQWVGTMRPAEISDKYGIRPLTLRSHINTKRPWHSLSFIDIDAWPEQVCPGCLMACERPWPCSAATRAFAELHRHDRTKKNLEIGWEAKGHGTKKDV